MDIKEKQARWAKEKPLFEAEFTHSHLLPFFKFNENSGDYEINAESVFNTDDEDQKVAFETINTGWAMWLRAKREAQAVPEGFILVSESKISCFYQDNDEPENCCLDASGFDSLGDCINDGEVMLVNKFTQANISKQQMFGAWCACDPKPLTRFIKEFKLFDTQEEAEQAMIEAQEQKG